MIALSHQIAILRLKTEFSSTLSFWCRWYWWYQWYWWDLRQSLLKDGQITRAKKFSQRNSVI